MSKELVATRKFRAEIPEAHRGSLDTRLRWLWHQRWGTVQTIYMKSPDLDDHTAATLVIQAVLGDGDLNSIEQLVHRLEGGAIADREVLERGDEPIRV